MDAFDGPESVQALYITNGPRSFNDPIAGPELVFEWGDTAPFNYDFFIVRWDLNGRNLGQTRVDGASSLHGTAGHPQLTMGRWTSPLKQEGRYRLVVEGADNAGFAIPTPSSRSRQGWTNPLYVDFRRGRARR
jgi:hypothetical protein